MRKIKRGKIIFFGLLIFFLGLNFSADIARAQQGSASLFLSPSSGSYQTGSTFSLSIMVNSQQQAMNAAEAVLKFDPSLLRVRSASKANSIFAFWPVEPTFSNTAGTINFTGGSPTAFRGTSGRIVAITFEALKEGTASVSFTQGKVLAADGLGTDITGNFTGGSYTITRAVTPAPVTPSLQTPQAPKISSPTHPDPEKWYSNNSPKFVWDLPSGITAIRLLVSKNPIAQPNQAYDSSASSFETKEIEDGIWFFSIQLQNQYGWGGIGRFKFQVDTTPPEPFTAKIDDEGDPTNPKPIFYFETTDQPSGIDYYEIILNDELYAKVKPEEMENGFYRPVSLPPGNYALRIKAIDKAGNYTLSQEAPEIVSPFEVLASLYFFILPIPLEIKEIPSKILVKEPLRIEGKTLSEIIARIYIQKEGEETVVKEIRSNRDGYFELEEFLSKGKYFIWVQVQDNRGALSEPMEKHPLEVVTDTLSFFLLIFLIILIIVGIFIIWILWKKVSEEKEKTKKEKAEEKVEIKQKAYNLLRDQIKKQVEYLEEKVDLSRAETRLLDELRKALEKSEKAREQEKEIET